jgi:hypothetical protein
MDYPTSRSRRCAALAVALTPLLATGLILAAPKSARADAPSLRWKFTSGEALHYQMDQKAVTEVKANGQSVKTTVSQMLETTWSVLSVASDGSAEMAQTIDRMKTKIESPFGQFEYDSKEPKAPEGPIAASIVPVLKALVGAKFRYKISPLGELSDVQVPEGLMKTLKDSGPTAGNAGMFSEDGLKNMIRESSLVLPAETVEKPWTRQKKIPSPPIGTQVVDLTYKYEGTENGEEKIGTSAKIALEPAPNASLDVKLGPQDGKGSFFFDAKAGRVVRSSVVQKLEMVINVMNTEVTQTSDSTTEMKLVKADPAPSK